MNFSKDEISFLWFYTYIKKNSTIIRYWMFSIILNPNFFYFSSELHFAKRFLSCLIFLHMSLKIRTWRVFFLQRKCILRCVCQIQIFGTFLFSKLRFYMKIFRRSFMNCSFFAGIWVDTIFNYKNFVSLFDVSTDLINQFLLLF